MGSGCHKQGEGGDMGVQVNKIEQVHVLSRGDLPLWTYRQND